MDAPENGRKKTQKLKKARNQTFRFFASFCG